MLKLETHFLQLPGLWKNAKYRLVLCDIGKLSFHAFRISGMLRGNIHLGTIRIPLLVGQNLSFFTCQKNRVETPCHMALMEKENQAVALVYSPLSKCKAIVIYRTVSGLYNSKIKMAVGPFFSFLFFLKCHIWEDWLLGKNIRFKDPRQSYWVFSWWIFSLILSSEDIHGGHWGKILLTLEPTHLARFLRIAPD